MGLSRRALLAGAGALIAAPGLAAQEAALAALAQDYLRAAGVPGLSVAAARGGRIVYAQGFGIADPASGAPATPDRLFRIADVSMAFTAAAAFALIGQGRLRLADRVFGPDGVLGEAYGDTRGMPFVAAVTVEHLLAHTVGGWAAGDGDPMLAQPHLGFRDLIAWTLKNRPLGAPPGRTFAYSRFGYCVLGRVLEQATHQWYATLMRDRVFHPCGIARMAIAGNTAALRAPGEVAYAGQGDDPYGFNIARMDAACGWIASAGDLARFAGGLPSVLGPASVIAMLTPAPANPAFGRGVALDGRGGWFHDGSLPGTSALVAHTAGGLSFAALANGRSADSVAGLRALMRDMARAAKDWR